MKRVVRLIVWPATSYSTYEPRTRHASRPRANKSESGWSAINAWRAKPIEGTMVICRTPSKISRLSRVSRTRIVLEVFSNAPFIVLPFAKRAPFAWKKWPAIFVRSTCHKNGRSGFFCPLDRAFESSSGSLLPRINWLTPGPCLLVKYGFHWVRNGWILFIVIDRR